MVPTSPLGSGEAAGDEPLERVPVELDAEVPVGLPVHVERGTEEAAVGGEEVRGADHPALDALGVISQHPGPIVGGRRPRRVRLRRRGARRGRPRRRPARRAGRGAARLTRSPTDWLTAYAAAARSSAGSELAGNAARSKPAEQLRRDLGADVVDLLGDVIRVERDPVHDLEGPGADLEPDVTTTQLGPTLDEPTEPDVGERTGDVSEDLDRSSSARPTGCRQVAGPALVGHAGISLRGGRLIERSLGGNLGRSPTVDQGPRSSLVGCEAADPARRHSGPADGPLRGPTAGPSPLWEIGTEPYRQRCHTRSVPELPSATFFRIRHRAGGHHGARPRIARTGDRRVHAVDGARPAAAVDHRGHLGLRPGPRLGHASSTGSTGRPDSPRPSDSASNPPRWAWPRHGGSPTPTSTSASTSGAWSHPVPKSFEYVLDHARHAGMDAFDPARPLWEFTLIEGLEDGQAALVMKLHHSLTDGIGGVQIATHVVDLQREPGDLGPMPRLPRPQPRRPLDAWRDLVSYDLARAVEIVRSRLTALPGDARHLIRDPFGSIVDAAETAASLARFVRPISTTLSPVMTNRRLQWHYDTLDVPLRAAQAGGQAGERHPQRRVRGGRRRRAAPLPRAPRGDGRGAAADDADQHPQRGRPRGRQPGDARAVRRTRRHRGPRRAHRRRSTGSGRSSERTGRCPGRTRSRGC